MRVLFFVFCFIPLMALGQGKLKVSKKDFTDQNTIHISVQKNTHAIVNQNNNWIFKTEVFKKTRLKSQDKKELNTVFYSLKDGLDSIKIKELKIYFLKNKKVKSKEFQNIEDFIKFANTFNFIDFVVISNYTLFHKSIEQVEVVINEPLPIQTLAVHIAIPDVFQYSILQFTSDEIKFKESSKKRVLSSKINNHYFERSANGLRKVFFTGQKRIVEKVFSGTRQDIKPASKNNTILIELN